MLLFSFMYIAKIVLGVFFRAIEGLPVFGHLARLQIDMLAAEIIGKALELRFEFQHHYPKASYNFL